MTIELVHNPDRTLHSVVSGLLGTPSITKLRAAISYVQLSGSAMLYDDLVTLRDRHGSASVVCAVDESITTYEGLQALLEAGVRVFVYRSAIHGFHPKAWLWYEGQVATASIVGSGNMTKGGLVRNVEVADYLHGSSTQTDAYFASLGSTIDRLEAASRAVTSQADLDAAAADFTIPHERAGRQRLAAAGGGARLSTPGVSPAPTPPLSAGAKALVRRLVTSVAPSATVAIPGRPPAIVTAPVSPTDVAGIEVATVLVEANPLRRPRTPGELRLPLPSLRLAPLFWEWPDSFTQLVKTGSVYWERHATCRFRSAGRADAVESGIRIYYYPRRVEFRITSSEFRARGDAGDVIGVEQSEVSGEDFLFIIVRRGEPNHGPLLALCTERMQGGRRWGFQ